MDKPLGISVDLTQIVLGYLVAHYEHGKWTTAWDGGEIHATAESARESAAEAAADGWCVKVVALMPIDPVEISTVQAEVVGG